MAPQFRLSRRFASYFNLRMTQPKQQLRTRVEKLEELVNQLLKDVETLKEKHEEEVKEKSLLKLDEEFRLKLEKERRKLVEELREARERELQLQQERDKEREARLLLQVELRKQRENALKLEQDRLKLEERLKQQDHFETRETAIVHLLDQISQSLKCMNLLSSPDTTENRLSFAVKTGNVEAARLLVNAGTDITAGDALHWAVKSGNLEICELLLQSGVQVNARALDNCTPLHVAALRGDVIMTKLLLKWKADVTMTHYDLTSSELARQAGHKMVAAYLQEIESGVRPIPT